MSKAVFFTPTELAFGLTIGKNKAIQPFNFTVPPPWGTQASSRRLVPHWARGRDAALYVTPQAATIVGAADTPGHALTFAHNRKISGAEEECRRQGTAFLPMAAEFLGCWHPAAKREVRKLGAALSRPSGHLWGRLGILLKRGNAAILANDVPSHLSAFVW